MGAGTLMCLAVPVCGCGFTNEHGFAGSVKGLDPEHADCWVRWWDPSAYLKDVRVPMLWVTGTNDFACTLNALQESEPVNPATSRAGDLILRTACRYIRQSVEATP